VRTRIEMPDVQTLYQSIRASSGRHRLCRYAIPPTRRCTAPNSGRVGANKGDVWQRAIRHLSCGKGRRRVNTNSLLQTGWATDEDAPLHSFQAEVIVKRVVIIRGSSHSQGSHYTATTAVTASHLSIDTAKRLVCRG
jgi:hypothetical protein